MTDWETDIFDKLDHIMLVGNFKGEWMNLIKSEIKKAVEEIAESLDYDIERNEFQWILQDRGIE